MRMKISSLLAGVLLTAAPLLAQQAPQWELRDNGQWQQVNAPLSAPVADPTLDRVEEMLANGQITPAKKLVLAWIKSNKESPIRDRAVYLLGEANHLYGHRIMAFYNFDEVMDLYPDSRYFYPSLSRQYEIADAYLNGYKRRFLGIPMLSAESEATEMLYRIQQRAPGSPLAEKALLRAADYYYASGDYDLAADAYGAYIQNYPRSPQVARVRLQQAFSALAQFRGIRFDATPIIDARQQLNDYAAAYPRLAADQNVSSIISRIDLALARKMMVVADLYRRTDKPQAAAYYYQFVVRNFPKLPEAAEAQRQLAKLPAVEASAPAASADKGLGTSAANASAGANP